MRGYGLASSDFLQGSHALNPVAIIHNFRETYSLYERGFCCVKLVLFYVLG